MHKISGLSLSKMAKVGIFAAGLLAGFPVNFFQVWGDYRGAKNRGCFRKWPRWTKRRARTGGLRQIGSRTTPAGTGPKGQTGPYRTGTGTAEGPDLNRRRTGPGAETARGPDRGHGGEGTRWTGQASEPAPGPRPHRRNGRRGESVAGRLRRRLKISAPDSASQEAGPTRSPCQRGFMRTV